MGKLTPAITGKLVAFDSAPLIYYFEEHIEYLAAADELFNAISQGLTRGMTSILTLLEVLVKPLHSGRHDLAGDYRRILCNTQGVAIYPIDRNICERAAQLRADNIWLGTPDAVQIATALEHGAEVIVTNDERWKRLSQIPIVVMKDYT